jgi:protein PhnA
MNNIPPCPKCNSEYTYQDGTIYVCPGCTHEWTKEAIVERTDTIRFVYDAYGNLLCGGDTVTLIKNLKIKGSSSVVKVGIKVKCIHLVEGDHNIDCKIDGIGAMRLKSEFVKKV